VRVAWLRAGLCLAVLGRAAAEEPPPAVKKVLALFDHLHQAELAERPAALLLRESDLNEYLSYTLREAPRPGLESVRVKIFPHNYVSTFAVVDFDAIEQWRPGAVPALLRPAPARQENGLDGLPLPRPGGEADVPHREGVLSEPALAALAGGKIARADRRTTTGRLRRLPADSLALRIAAGLDRAAAPPPAAIDPCAAARPAVVD
jgi:hypothetical protein